MGQNLKVIGACGEEREMEGRHWHCHANSERNPRDLLITEAIQFLDAIIRHSFMRRRRSILVSLCRLCGAIWPHNGLHVAVRGGLNSETDKYCLLNRNLLKKNQTGVRLKIGAIFSPRTIKIKKTRMHRKQSKSKAPHIIGMTRLRFESVRVVTDTGDHNSMATSKTAHA